jgi:Rrf2 family protein
MSMQVSTKGRYGLRILLDIASHEQEGPVTLRDMAQRQEISQKYLWQVINPLKVAGVLRAIRGTSGGYVLARSPKEITVQEIVEILEGPMTMVRCTRAPGSCHRSPACTARLAWAEIEQRVRETMAGITLHYLLEQQAQRAASSTSYDI